MQLLGTVLLFYTQVFVFFKRPNYIFKCLLNELMGKVKISVPSWEKMIRWKSKHKIHLGPNYSVLNKKNSIMMNLYYKRKQEHLHVKSCR